MPDIKKFSGFTFNHSDVSGNRLDKPASETKALFDSRGNELMEFINYIIELLNSISGADYISAKDIDGTKKTIQFILDKVNNGVYDVSEEFQYLKETFENLVINSGNSNAEVVVARYDKITKQNFDDLGKRLDDLRTNILNHSNIIACEELPEIKKKNTFYFKITDKQSVNNNGNIKVSPNMGLKLVDENVE